MSMDFSMGSLAFWAVGFGIMFGASSTRWFGTSGFFLSDYQVGGDPWVLAFLMFKLIDKSVGLRVSPEDETEGLDLVEHGGNAYRDFGISSTRGVGYAGRPPGPPDGHAGEPVGQLKRVEQT